MNQTPKSVLADYTPFEVFYNRPNKGSSNKMLKKVRIVQQHKADKMVEYSIKKSL